MKKIQFLIAIMFVFITSNMTANNSSPPTSDNFNAETSVDVIMTPQMNQRLTMNNAVQGTLVSLLTDNTNIIDLVSSVSNLNSNSFITEQNLNIYAESETNSNVDLKSSFGNSNFQAQVPEGKVSFTTNKAYMFYAHQSGSDLILPEKTVNSMNSNDQNKADLSVDSTVNGDFISFCRTGAIMLTKWPTNTNSFSTFPALQSQKEGLNHVGFNLKILTKDKKVNELN